MDRGRQMAGKLIVIDGTDASGKQTQSKLITSLLFSRDKKVMHISFPNYEEDYCAPVRMYLKGEFGQDPPM
jgi:dTMP kinase